MNKTELIAAMAARSGLTKKEAGAALASLADGITDALKEGYTFLPITSETLSCHHGINN